VEPGETLFCPICKEPIPVIVPKVTEIAPLEPESAPWWVRDASVPASELTPINPKTDAFLVFAPSPASDAPTVVGGPALNDPTLPDETLADSAEALQPILPQSSTEPTHGAASVAAPRRGLRVAALLPGVVAFAVVWSPALVYLGLMLSALGLLFSVLMLGQGVARGRRGTDFLLAAFVVNLQSLILAIYFIAS
jgi:hypothetical protein